MQRRNKRRVQRRVRRRAIGNLLIGLGVVLLAVVGGYFGWTVYRGQQVQAELHATLPPMSQVEATVIPVIPTDAMPASATAAPQSAPAATPLATPPALTTAPAAQATQPPVTSVSAPTPKNTPTPISVSAGEPVRLVFSVLKIDAKVVEMGWRAVDTPNGPQAEWVIPENAAGHHINSAMLGERDNVVISGHNNIYGRVFEAISLAWDDDRKQAVDANTDLSSVLNGRSIELYNAAGQRFTYTVTAFYRLKDTGVSLAQRIENGRFMQPTADAQLTLVTCWPITSNTHRLIVVAKPAG